MVSRIVDPRIEAEAFLAESRSDGRRAERVKEEALARLAADLTALKPKQLGALELGEELVDLVDTARAITSPAAKNRQLRLIRVALRREDWASVRVAHDALLEHGSVAAAALFLDGATAWAVRLAGEGMPALNAFVTEFPRADRAHLGQLLRAVQKASHERPIRAERKVESALRGVLR